MSNPKDEAAKKMASALRMLLVPYKRVSDASLIAAFNDKRVPAGLGKHQPGEIMLARMALADYERAIR